MTHLFYRKHFLPLVCCLVGGLCFTACSDDDDTAAIPDTELTDAESNTAQELARLVHMLCEVDALPTGWATANFTPTVGEADDANPAVQKLAVADAVEALSYYNALTAQQLEAGTAADVWRCDGLGSLTFAALNAADCFATIDVDIKQVPQLKQIRLVPASALGDNAGGEAYYRFGDLIKDYRDNTVWVCGRPANAACGKKKSYWFSFQITDSHISHKTVATKTNYGFKVDHDYYLPKNLGSTSDKIAALGEFLTLLCFPEKYEDYVADGRPGGLGGVCNGSADDVKHLLRVVNRAWKQTDFHEQIFDHCGNMTYDEVMNIFRGQFCFYFDGYKSKSGYFKLPTVNFNTALEQPALSGDPGNPNLPKPRLLGTVFRDLQVKHEQPFDIRTYVDTYTKGDNLLMSSDYLMPYGFVVRMKTGYELSSKLVGNPDITQPLPGYGDGGHLGHIYTYKQLHHLFED